MRSEERFPRAVERIEVLDVPVREALWQHLYVTAQVRQILVLPPYEHWVEGEGWRRWLLLYRKLQTPERTVVLTDTALLIASREHAGAQAVVTQVPLCEMLAFELGTMLLRGWLQITWRRADSVEQIVLDFNTVGFRKMRALLAVLQNELAEAEPAERESPALSRSEIERLPLKFLNLLRLDALLPGEKVLALVFEPTALRRWIFGLGGREGKLWAVTDQHSLLLREPPHLFPYGEVTTFCPRRCVRAVNAIETARGIELQLCLGAGDYVLSTTFKAERAIEVKTAAKLWRERARARVFA